jgi:hypothetical protein
MATHFPALSVTVGQRRWPCVLDPALALSRHGLTLAQRLGDLMEVWVVRELWHILDNTHFYRHKPEALLPPGARGEGEARALAASLAAWERARLQTDLGGLKLFWVGDGPGESFLPHGADPRLAPRCEALARALDRRLPREGRLEGSGLGPAFRDAAALGAALGAAFVLTARPPQGAPPICDALAGWGVSCAELGPGDELAALERAELRRLCVHAGLAELFWAGLGLSVLHVMAPPAPGGPDAPPAGLDGGDGLDEDEPARADFDQPDLSEDDPWTLARAFWYPI